MLYFYGDHVFEEKLSFQCPIIKPLAEEVMSLRQNLVEVLEWGESSLVTMSNEKNSSHLVFSIFICNYNILCMQYYFCFIIVHHINHIYHPLSHSLLHVLQAEALAAFSPKLSFKDVCLVNNFGG